MQFTAKELKLIERVRKEERQRRRWRWFLLALCLLWIINAALWSYLFSQLFPLPDPLPDSDVPVILVLWTQCLALVFLWIVTTKECVLQWRGDVERRLLLRLLEANHASAGTGLRAV
jgi:hypothetical protein